MRLGLERSVAALEALGNPHLGLSAVIVGGSNGKGSVSAMIERAARVSGLRTGLYTSPHLVRYNERIQIDGRPIDDDAFTSSLERVFRDAPDELTFFETLTMAAFVALRDAKVDFAVLEVGLGGRLDATNVVPEPVATAIVSLTAGQDGRHLEHADLLGSTVGEIAFEKAGILRRGAPAVIGPLSAEARGVIVGRAAEVAVEPLWEVSAEGEASPPTTPSRAARLEALGEEGLLSLPDGKSYRIATALRGPHQLVNAAVAASTLHLAAERLGSRAEALRSAIEPGLRAATWPGRLEKIEVAERGIDVWLDCAHNLDGARALVAAAPGLGLDPARTALVFGALADKAYEPFLRLVAPLAMHRFYAEPGGRAPAPLSELGSIAKGEPVGDPSLALDRALAAVPRGGAVLVTGSIYLVGAVRASLVGERRDPPVGL